MIFLGCSHQLSVFRALLGLSVFGLVSACSVHAHEAGLSIVEVKAGAETLELSASYALADVQRMLPPSVRLGTDSSKSTIEAAQASLDELASLLWDTRVDGAPLAPSAIRIEFTPSDNLAFRLVYPRPIEGLIAFRSANLGSLPSAHRELFTVFDEHGRTRLTRTLTVKESVANVSMVEISNDPVPEPTSGVDSGAVGPVGSVFREYFVLGVEHIWMGYDHLLFLLGLLLVCRSFRSIVVIITCFTLAHSLTLGLAALDLVSLPGWLVEPLIAASIVFVGVENVLSRESKPRGRGWLTFGFGLIHGFGFASVLRDLGLGAHGRGIAVPLVSFNLGVEAGQVCFAAVVIPVLAGLFRLSSIRKHGVAVASTLVALAGFYWLIERALFG